MNVKLDTGHIPKTPHLLFSQASLVSCLRKFSLWIAVYVPKWCVSGLMYMCICVHGIIWIWESVELLSGGPRAQGRSCWPVTNSLRTDVTAYVTGITPLYGRMSQTLWQANALRLLSCIFFRNSSQSHLKAIPNYNWETPWSTLALVSGILVADKTTQTIRGYTRTL